MRRQEKIQLIEEKNPDWKELVTEKGFVYDKTPWSDRVKQVLDEIKNDK